MYGLNWIDPLVSMVSTSSLNQQLGHMIIIHKEFQWTRRHDKIFIAIHAGSDK